MLKNFLFHLRAVEADASQGEPANCSEILPFQPFHILDAIVFWCAAWSLSLCFSGKVKSIKTQELHLPHGAKSMELLPLHQLQEKKGETWEQLPSGTTGELACLTCSWQAASSQRYQSFRHFMCQGQYSSDRYPKQILLQSCHKERLLHLDQFKLFLFFPIHLASSLLSVDLCGLPSSTWFGSGQTYLTSIIKRN